MNRSMPGLPVHHQLLEFTQTHIHRIGDPIQPSRPLSSPFPPTPNPSQHQSLFQWVKPLPKYWRFSFSINCSSEYPGLISFRMDWLDLLAVQGTLKSLLQHHSSKTSIFQRSAFFTVQLSHPYMTTGKLVIIIIQNVKAELATKSCYWSYTEENNVLLSYPIFCHYCFLIKHFQQFYWNRIHLPHNLLIQNVLFNDF